MIASTGDVFRVNFYHRGRKEEGGGRRRKGLSFLALFVLLCRLSSSIYIEKNQKKKKKRKKKEGKKKDRKHKAATSSLELLTHTPPSKTPHSLVCVRSLGPARSHRRTNERIRSIHFPTARNGLEVNFDRKWIKSFRVELVAADERHAAPRVAFQFCNENVKRRERERERDQFFPRKVIYKNGNVFALRERVGIRLVRG